MIITVKLSKEAWNELVNAHKVNYTSHPDTSEITDEMVISGVKEDIIGSITNTIRSAKSKLVHDEVDSIINNVEVIVDDATQEKN